ANFDQHRDAAPTIAPVGGIAPAPVRADRRDTGGGAAAEDGYPHRVSGIAFVNSRKKFSRVTAASCPGSMPLSVATAAAGAATKAGSLRLPRYGTGARYGASVSTSSRSSGSSRAIARRSSALRNVTMPDSEM